MSDKDCVFDFKLASSNDDDVYMDYGLSEEQDCSSWIPGGHWSASARARTCWVPFGPMLSGRLCQHSPQPAAFSSALRFSSAIPGPAASRYFCAKVKCDNFVDDCDLTVTLSPPAPS